MKRILMAAAIIGLLTVPSMAEGFFVELDTWYAQPDNSQVFGAFKDESSSKQLWRPVSFEFDNEFTFELVFGYDFGTFGALSASYWDGYDDGIDFYTDDTQNDGHSNTYFTPGGNMWDEIFFHFETDAKQIEIAWSNSVPGKGKWTVDYTVGLRYFEYDFASWNRNWDSTDDVYKWANSESDGLGLFGGLGGNFAFTDNYSIHGGFDVAFLSGDRDVYYGREYSWATSNNKDWRNSTDETFVQYGLDLGFKFFIFQGLYGDFGYKYANWKDVATRVNYKQYGMIDDDDTYNVGWDGFYLNVGYDFGK